MEAFLWFVL
ncbi:replication-associated A domain protein, partial [Chlamydia psittaci 02DC24]